MIMMYVGSLEHSKVKRLWFVTDQKKDKALENLTEAQPCTPTCGGTLRDALLLRLHSGQIYTV